MRAKLNFKILLLFICLCVLASAAVAQEKKPQAILIGEYQFSDEPTGEFSAFERMTEQLIFRLTQEPATTVGLINIIERSVLGERVKAILAKHPELNNKIRYGSPNQSSYKPDAKMGFWIVPLGAEMPDVGSDEPPCECPILDVRGDHSFEGAVVLLTFTASVEGKKQKEIKYKWYVSAGKIIEGQGTKTIKVELKDAEKITATVSISGTCEDEICPLTRSESVFSLIKINELPDNLFHL